MGLLSMPVLLPAAGTAAGYALGGPTGALAGATAGSAIAGYLGQQEANAANAEQARSQMTFQEHMSSTAYQRAVSDLRAAGLNPMLAYSQGGASSPVGAQAHIENSAAGLGSGLSSAIDSFRLKKEIGQADVQNKLSEEAIETQKTQQDLNISSAEAAEANADKSHKEAELIELQKPAVQKKSEYDAKKYEYDSDFIPEDSWLRRVSEGSGILKDVTDALKPRFQFNYKGGKK